MVNTNNEIESNSLMDNADINPIKSKAKNGRLINKQKNKIQIWISYLYGNILIKNLQYTIKKLNISDITIEEERIDRALIKLRKIVNYDVKMEHLEQIYCYESEEEVGTNVTGYIFKVSSHEESDMILMIKHCWGEFVSYKNIEDVIIGRKRTDAFREAYTYLLTYMEDKYGISEYDLAQLVITEPIYKIQI